MQEVAHSSESVGGKIVKLDCPWVGRENHWSTQISNYVITGIEPFVIGLVQTPTVALGLSWHICSLGLDQPMTDFIP